MGRNAWAQVGDSVTSTGLVLRAARYAVHHIALYHIRHQ